SYPLHCEQIVWMIYRANSSSAQRILQLASRDFSAAAGQLTLTGVSTSLRRLFALRDFEGGF
ncbi:MAG: hypothetical protein ACXVKH_16260, partial [Candidatus Angelobacter sp.]